jgi:hypothetical protein
MPDEKKPNLEPIEESDLSLKEKFIGEVPEGKIESIVTVDKETVPAPEKTAERKEGVAEKEDAYAKILSKVGSSQPAPVKTEEVTSDAAVANQETDAESKINNLVNLAENKGVSHAVKVARHMEDNYVLDEFHDRMLGEELHEALVKKGLIKEI